MKILQGLKKNGKEHKLCLKMFDLWFEGLAKNLPQKDFMLSLFKLPHIKHVIFNG